MNPQRVELVPHSALSARPDGPDSSCSPQWQSTMLQKLACGAPSAAQTFSPYLPHALQANERPKNAMNPQRVELVPHSALSARLRWTRFLLQSLRRPLGYTECPHLDPDSPVAEHNASKVNSQQRRGFHPTCHMHCKQMRAKKRNEPPKGRTCPSRCSECPLPMDPIPLAVAATPPGVHRMPSLGPRLPSGRAQRFKSQQSAAQTFSSYLPHALQANEGQKTQ